jgi:hypothetical protein
MAFGLEPLRHEGNQGIAHGLLHRLLGGSVEGQSIDHGANNPNEFPDGVGYIGIVSAQAVHPSHDEGVACPEHVEQAPPPSWAVP